MVKTMARKYRKLCYEDRRVIERMLQEGNSIERIAIGLGVHRDTIYKEIARSGTTKETYTADTAQKAL